MSKVASSSRQSMKTAEYDDESSSELMSSSLGVGLAKKQTKSTTDTSRNVKAMYDKIESIKSTISMANAERAELWIQRQNLQDLYHQIILGADIDFVIDKKLEQDLWNYVFKTEINYFQSQIREQSHASSQATQSSSSSNATSSSIQQQQHAKKFECQANLALFLEAARGFYTRLLEDVLIKYHMTELSQLLNASATIAKKSRHSAVDSDTEKHLKQINYICQHILTHLGDIARYQSLYEEAKQYYSHAIRLVPYLGQPYNQLGILLETTRTNQLATVFYYMRSISVRYAFPLASTNLENFFNKLIEVPLSRFMPSITTSANEVKSVPIKLPHMDLIALFLQINAMLYFSVKKTTSVNENKLSQLFELFKTSFVSFIETPVQKERLDALQFTQMITIVIFHFANTPHRIALELLLFLFEQLVYLASSRSYDLILTPLYISLSFLSHLNTPSTLIADNKLWESSANVEKYVRALVKCLNEFDASSGESSDDDVPISDDRMLECYLPMREWHKKLDFKKPTINSQEEKKLRKRRIVEIFERALADESSENEYVKETKCYIQLISKKDTDRFSVSRHCPISSPIRNEKEITEEKQPPSNSPSSATGSTRKRRQNVAIASITGEVSESSAAEVVEGSKSTTTTKSTPPQNRLAAQPQQQQRTTSSNILPQWQPQPQSKPQPSNSQQKPSFFPSALTSNRQLITSANSQAAYPRPTLHQPGQEQFRPVNSSNNGFPSFLPTPNNDSAAFRADLGNKFPNTNANNTTGNLFRVVPNQQIEWLLQQQKNQQQQQQQQQQQNNLQKSSGNMPLLNAFSSNQATFDHLRSSNQGSSSIWSPGAFPSASSNKNTPQMHGIDLNPSMESWQKGLNLPPPTATNEYDMSNRSAIPGNHLGLGQQQQQQQKDAQKSFEFNLNMMNMMNMLNNTLVLPSNDPNSSIWVNSNSNNEQK